VVDLDPPFPLSLPARRHWDRLAACCHGPNGTCNMLTCNAGAYSQRDV
jgi:hypothetical protein